MLHGLSDVDGLTKSIALTAIGLYAIGLVTVNDYHYRIGVADFAILRTRYILTGLLVAASLALIGFWGWCLVEAFSLARSRHTIKPSKKPHDLEWIDPWMPLMTMLSFVPMFFLLIVGDFSFESALLDAPLLEASLFLGSVVLPVGILRWVIETRGHSFSDYPRLRLLVLYPIKVIAFTLVFIIYIDIFSGTIYPLVPQPLGGGRPEEIILIVADSAIAQFGAGKLDIIAEGNTSKTLDLLWETDQQYFVRSANDREAEILRIDKDSIIAVVGGPEL